MVEHDRRFMSDDRLFGACKQRFLNDDVTHRTILRAPLLAALPLEHVPAKLNDFSDKNMLHSIDLEHVPFDRVSLPDRKTL